MRLCRDNNRGHAGRLASGLAAELGPPRVFSDIEIPAGSDFADVLHCAVSACDDLSVVISRRWAAESANGLRSILFETATGRRGCRDKVPVHDLPTRELPVDAQ